MSSYNGAGASQEITSSQLAEGFHVIQERLSDVQQRTSDARTELEAIRKHKAGLVAKHNQLLLTKEERRVQWIKLKSEVEALRAKKKLNGAIQFKEEKEVLLNKDKRVQVNEDRIKTVAERKQLRVMMATSREKMKAFEETFNEHLQEMTIELNRASALKKRELFEAKKSISKIPVDPKFHEFRYRSQLELKAEASKIRGEMNHLKQRIDTYNSMISQAQFGHRPPYDDAEQYSK